MKTRLGILLLLPCVALAQTADEKQATVAYLRSFEAKAGGFLPSAKASTPSLRATSSALRALKYFGGSAANVEGAKRFILACYDSKTGGFADTPGGKPDVLVTAVGLMALVELKIPTEKYEKAAISFLMENAKEFEQIRMTAAGLEAIGKTCEKNKAWIAELIKQKNANGTYGEGKNVARATGGVVACILRLGGKADAGVIPALDTTQLDDGGFGIEESDLETSYRVMRTYHMLKAKPKRADDLRKFIAKCRNADGGYGLKPGQASNLGATYFAGIILHWLDAK